MLYRNINNKLLDDHIIVIPYDLKIPRRTFLNS